MAANSTGEGRNYRSATPRGNLLTERLSTSVSDSSPPVGGLTPGVPPVRSTPRLPPTPTPQTPGTPPGTPRGPRHWNPFGRLLVPGPGPSWDEAESQTLLGFRGHPRTSPVSADTTGENPQESKNQISPPSPPRPRTGPGYTRRPPRPLVTVGVPGRGGGGRGAEKGSEKVGEGVSGQGSV